MIDDAAEKRRNHGDGRRSRLLALIPLGVAVLFAPLAVPRRAPPDAVPIPLVDARALDGIAARDHTLAENARRAGLPDDLRALGSALRIFHSAEARGAEAREIAEARAKVDDALRAAAGVADATSLAQMRAVQLETFLAEERAFEKTGVESAELSAIGGSFVKRMRREGWLRDHTLAFDEPVLRVLFKQMWNAVLGLEARADLAPAVDELRALYAFFIAHPHAPEGARLALDAARRGAKDQAACDAIDAGERYAAETWRLDRVARLAAIDPSYPAAYARGVVLYRRGSYVESIAAFTEWLRDHPTGPWSLRAQNHLRAAHDAASGAAGEPR